MKQVVSSIQQMLASLLSTESRTAILKLCRVSWGRGKRREREKEREGEREREREREIHSLINKNEGFSQQPSLAICHRINY